MIDKGANPFVVDYNRETWAVETLSLSGLPRQKSVYFTTQPFPDRFKRISQFSDPWFYKTGVFDGKFGSVIGQGAAGTVIKGEWFGRKAAFKFVEIGNQKIPDSKSVVDALKSLNGKLSEMITIQSTFGSKIVSFYGHYR